MEKRLLKKTIVYVDRENVQVFQREYVVFKMTDKRIWRYDARDHHEGIEAKVTGKKIPEIGRVIITDTLGKRAILRYWDGDRTEESAEAACINAIINQIATMEEYLNDLRWKLIDYENRNEE